MVNSFVSLDIAVMKFCDKLHYFLIRCAQSKITLFIFCIIESEQETKDTQFVVSAVILSRVTNRVLMSNLLVFI